MTAGLVKILKTLEKKRINKQTDRQKNLCTDLGGWVFFSQLYLLPPYSFCLQGKIFTSWHYIALETLSSTYFLKCWHWEKYFQPNMECQWHMTGTYAFLHCPRNAKNNLNSFFTILSKSRARVKLGLYPVLEDHMALYGHCLGHTMPYDTCQPRHCTYNTRASYIDRVRLKYHLEKYFNMKMI